MRRIDSNDDELQAQGFILDAAAKQTGQKLMAEGLLGVLDAHAAIGNIILWQRKIETSKEIKPRKPRKQKLEVVEEINPKGKKK